MMKNISTEKVFFNDEGYQAVNRCLKEHNYSRIFILVDSNSHVHCLSPFLNKLEAPVPVEVLEMEAGEKHKTIDTCTGIWSALSELGADRKSLLINLGGGVVTDLGGFVAGTYKRGIHCLHFPTTLLAMVDAALGGKNGVNLEGVKNQVGMIRNPEMVVMDTSFLQTLPPAEMRSGLAEMLKHGLISDEQYWHKLSDLASLDLMDLEDLIAESIRIKEGIVQQDPTEKHLRKSLNFGHTLGHAIESYLLESPDRQHLLHGEAVAIGMVLEGYLSTKIASFPEPILGEIKQVILGMYGRTAFSRTDQEKIIELLKFDKKNEGGKINFVLLRKIGEPVMDIQVPNELIFDAFRYYAE